MQLLVVAAVLGVTQATLMRSPVIPREDSMFELRCPMEDAGPLAYWLVHGEGTALPPDTVTEEFTVHANGSIVFKSVKMHHEGRHLCIREVETRLEAFPVTLRVRPRPSDNLWRDAYQGQFVTGLVAGLVVLTICGLSCLVYNRRWRPVEKPDSRPIIKEGLDNPALTHDEKDEEHNTHM